MPLPRRLSQALSQAPRVLAIAAFVAVLLTLDHPGITIDEPLDVRPGRTYVETLLKEGVGFFRPATVEKVFRDNAEHPPLGRWLLGIASKLGQTFEIMLSGGADPLGLYVRSGRLAPAICFACLVWLVTREARTRHGEVAGWAAGLSLIAMPRVFSHAHLGALDLFIAFFWTTAFLSVDRAFESDRPEGSFAKAGICWGLALLTKIHAWLLPPLVILRWLTVRPKNRPAVGVLLWGAVGLILFVVGWPWLWYDPVGRFSKFLGTGVERSTIRVLYFGTVYDDKHVPWHYPWVYFAVTVPLGLQVFGAWGVVRAWLDRKIEAADLRVLFTILYLLAIFSTNVAVYDGERLFLTVFPLWSLLIGRGFADLWDRAKNSKIAIRALTLAFACQFWGVVSIHPFGLSYYNLAVGGLAGAERLGLEVAYWSESVDRRLLDQLAIKATPRAPAVLAPTLAPGQGKMATTRTMIGRPVILEDQERLDSSDWLVVYRREAYFSPELRRALQEGETIYQESRQGVWLSALVRLSKTRRSP